MKKNVRLMVLVIFALFVMPLVFVQGVSAGPLESFAENPIPYWDDNSLDTSLTWDSTEQTVTLEYEDKYEIGWYEDGTNATEWIELGCEAGDEHSSDGISIVLEFDNDANPDWDNFYTNEPGTTATDTHLEIKIKRNISIPLYVKWYTLDSKGGTFGSQLLEPTVGDWTIYEVTLTQVVECFEVYGQTTTADAKVEIDYIRIDRGGGDLDVRVPINRQSIQSIEFMSNFSALDSTVRFQMYDNNTASGLWCDVNNSIVTFPDASYAEFTEVARINFSLNDELRIFKIYVSAENTTLINYYSSYAGLANKDFFRMADSAFNGSYQLLYLQGDLGYLAEVIDTDNIFYLLFLSLDMWGYLGPIGLVIAGYFLTKKETVLGILWFVVECLFMAQYFDLVSATPQYWWHIFILLLGGLFTCVYPLWDR